MPDQHTLRLSSAQTELKALLDAYVDRYNRPEFIDEDPISIPHRYHDTQDIEIVAFWTAIFSWGQRKTIINKANALFDLMGRSPYDFIRSHRPHHRKRFAEFVHRTFQYTDTLYFLEFFQQYYRKNRSLEPLFEPPIKDALINFHNLFFSLENAPHRTRKHIATPARKSTCKRLNMFLRWMVRKDHCGVDFGLWTSINPSALLMPLDVHVERVARVYGLLSRKQRDWQAVEELTANLRAFDPNDPCKYDFALFGLGVLDGQPFNQ